MALSVINNANSTPTSLLQGSNFNPQSTAPAAAINSTMNLGATTPTTPKQTYINNQAQSTQPQQDLSGQYGLYNGTVYNKSNNQGLTLQQFAQARGMNPNNINWNNLKFDTNYNPNQQNQQTYSFMNGTTFNASGQQVNPQPTQLTSATSNTTPINPYNNFNGTSTGTAGQGVYDPYNSPAYSQYVANAAAAYQPNQAILDYMQQIRDVENNYQLGDIALKSNPSTPEPLLQGQEALLQQQALARGNYAQSGLQNALTQQGYQIAGAEVPLNAANANANYLAGLATPTPISTGQSLTQLNPATGQVQNLGGIPSFAAGTNSLTGVPYTYNQQTGQINNGGTGLGTTPPVLGGQAGEAGALQTVASTYGLTDPASQLALKTAVDNTLASNGDVNAAGVPANLQPAVKAVLNQMSNGQYSPGNAAINQTNLANQQAIANTLIAPAKTAVQHLGDLQDLANSVNFSNSPFSNDIRSKFSNSILTDPSITNLQSAIGVVRAEVAKVLGGGTATVASQEEASQALPDNLSPQNIAGVIANVQTLMNQKITEYSNPQNAATLPTGLNNTTSNYSAPPPGTFALQ